MQALEAEFETVVHVWENVFRLFPAVLSHGVAAILKRGQFIQPVFRDEPAADIRTAFIGLKSARYKQRELPALPDKREVTLDEELEEIPIARALLDVLFAEEFLVSFVVFLVLLPAGRKFLVRFEFFFKPFLKRRAVHAHFAELRFAAIKAGGKFLADWLESFPWRIADDAIEAGCLRPATICVEPARPEMERKTARFARQVFGLEMFNKIGTDSFAQGERFIQRLVFHRVLDVTGAEFGKLLEFGPMIFGQPRGLFLQFHVHERIGGMEVQFEVREDFDNVGF